MSEEYASLDGKVPLDLYENWDTAEEARKGGVKTYKVTGDGGLIYDSGKSDYVVTVERVLGVDGWEKTTGHDNAKIHTQLMTLIILKIVVTRKKPDCCVRSVTATLSFENQESGPKASPVVEAWAPFRNLQLTNATTATFKQKDKMGAEREWHTMAYATPSMNSDPESRQRGGVMWYMEQSEIQVNSVPPETYAAVLFTRESDAPYVVRFDIGVSGGTVYDLRKNIKRGPLASGRATQSRSWCNRRPIPKFGAARAVTF